MAESKILTGARQAVAYARGDKVAARVTVVTVPAEVDVRQIRENLKMTQEEFSARFGFTLGSIRNWEQGHRRPEGPARILLTVIAKAPDAVMNALLNLSLTPAD